jgi:integrase
MEQIAFEFVLPDPPAPEVEREAAEAKADPKAVISSLADLRGRIGGEGDLPHGRRRDLLSALKRFEEISGRPLSSTPATAAAIREVFAGAAPVKLGIKHKTLQTLRSNVVFALKRYGQAKKDTATLKLDWNPEWPLLIGRIAIGFQRHSLSRLASFCSRNAISPDAVDVYVLQRFFDALEAEEAIKGPKSILKNTISNWNRAAREVEGWPQIPLRSPRKRKPFALQIEDFPETFGADIEQWKARVSLDTSISLFDDDEIAKPLRPPTVESRLLLFRTLATALVRSGSVAIDQVKDLATICHPLHLSAALSFLFERDGPSSKRRLSVMANIMRRLAKHHCRVSADDQEELSKLCARIRVKRKVGLTSKNKSRLEQLDVAGAIKRLRLVPVREAQLARTTRNPLRAVKAMERAVMISILLSCGPRITSLRKIELDWLVWRPSGEVEVHFPQAAMKADVPHAILLAPSTAALLRDLIDLYRPRLPGSEGPFLFPGKSGGPRSKNAAFEAVKGAAARAGFEINPHLYRHILLKIAMKKSPESAAAVSAVLGHQSLDTAYKHYGGADSLTAGEYLDELLNGAAPAQEDPIP